MIKKILLILFLILFAVPCVFAYSHEGEDGIKVINNKPGIYVIKIDTKKFGAKIKPLADWNTPNSVYEHGDYKLVLNGGFFDRITQAPVSYVVIDGELKQSPFDNQPLIQSLTEEGRLDAVLSRAELRIYQNKCGKFFFDIVKHTDGVPKDCQIIHSLQAGPLLKPTYNLQEEGFVTLDEDGNVLRESVHVTKRRERTILGLKGNDLYIIIFSKTAKATMNEAHDFCQKLRLKKAMALDGGGSTSVIYKDLKIFSEGDCGREIKSFLVIEN